MAHMLQTPSQLSSHLRALRLARGWSQETLGIKLGLDQTRVSKIENDPLSISVDQLLKVLDALGVLVQLLERNDAPFPSVVTSHTRAGYASNKQPGDPAPGTKSKVTTVVVPPDSANALKTTTRITAQIKQAPKKTPAAAVRPTPVKAKPPIQIQLNEKAVRATTPLVQTNAPTTSARKAVVALHKSVKAQW